MSSPRSASEKTLPEPLVTPDVSAQHDCSTGADHPHGTQRRHLPVRDQLVHQDVQQVVPSPSRAESPTARQWANPPSAVFSLKKGPKIPPLEKPPHPGFSHTPQLSERDSIFATHYLPSDPEGFSTPPVQEAEINEGQINRISDLDDASATPIPTSKVLPHRPHGDASHMEVDIHRTHPLRPPSFFPPSTSVHPSRLSVGSNIDWEKQNREVDERLQQTPTLEKLQPRQRSASGTTTTNFDHPSSGYGLTPSVLIDDSSSHQSAMFPFGHELPATNDDPAFHPRSEEFSRDGAHESKVDRSTSRGHHRGRVENSIEANLTNAETATHVRSRKSSHYLGLFKENTTSPDRKRREDRGKKHDEPSDLHDTEHVIHEETAYPLESHDAGSAWRFQPSSSYQDTNLRNSKSLSHLSLTDAPSIEPPPEANLHHPAYSDSVTKQHLRALPRGLLEEIRNFHLTPGGVRGSSFSKSIPTQFAEGGHEYIQAESSFEELSPPSDTNEELRRDSAQFEDEDEENEQISSAVYFPHESVTVDQFEPFPQDEDDVPPFDAAVAAESGHKLVPEAGDIPDEQEVSHVDISLRSKNESRILHGDLQDLQAPLDDINEKQMSAISERSSESTCESELPSADDSGHSAREEESSLTDDADMTPTATPTQRPRHLRPRRKDRTPVGAVELKPYRHQVGGHTTVFRFSRRAVCKQLNNRENEFYERIERRHPEMLMFLPRYIGVLNVTFSKNPKRSKSRPPKGQSGAETVHDHPDDAGKVERMLTNDSKPARPTETDRIFSQKQVTGIIPKVILENNRHIIPLDLFSRPERPRTADDATMSKRLSPNGRPPVSNGQEFAGDSFEQRQDDLDWERHNISWGATTVNRRLQEQVLREVFSPPAIHQHRRRARGHLALPRTGSDTPRRRANLSEDHTMSSRRPVHELTEPPRSSAIDIVQQSSEGRGLSSSASTALDAHHKGLERIRTEESQPRASSLSRARQVRRRHSGSGLQRRGSMNSGKAGDLMFFDDDGYGGDKEDEIFSMESDPSMAPDRSVAQDATSPTPEDVISDDRQLVVRQSPDASSIPTLHFTPNDDLRFHLPSNPKEAQTQKDERVQFFLLLEDLTAGMNKPCVLDLKMGTRQYGIEADDKKRKSQRRKCQSTTSQQLGVRLCGMQTWNIKKQEYAFEDKYFGRDLKSGREFQDALTRFLYDGVSYTSVAKKIPIILEQLSKLESMIRRLDGYRLYASSLLILYDGEQGDAENASKSDSPTKRAPLQRRISDDGRSEIDVHLKIVDFANCVTGEDPMPESARCPPQHPGDIDRGYLRGLRTLRMYFQRILKEVRHDDYVERGEGEGVALGSRTSGLENSSDRYWDEGVMESDPGEVSF